MNYDLSPEQAFKEISILIKELEESPSDSDIILNLAFFQSFDKKYFSDAINNCNLIENEIIKLGLYNDKHTLFNYKFSLYLKKFLLEELKMDLELVEHNKKFVNENYPYSEMSIIEYVIREAYGKGEGKYVDFKTILQYEPRLFFGVKNYCKRVTPFLPSVEEIRKYIHELAKGQKLSTKHNRRKFGNILGEEVHLSEDEQFENSFLKESENYYK